MKTIVSLVLGVILLASQNEAANQISMKNCMDVLILVDKSCSINDIDKNQVRQGLLDLVDMFPSVGTSAFDRVRISIVTFAEVPKVKNYDDENDTLIQLSFKDGKTKRTVKNVIRNMELRTDGDGVNEPCKTKTWKAFNYVWNQVFNKTEAENGNRPNVSDVILMVYDGITYPHEEQNKSIANARLLKSRGVEIFAVAPMNLNTQIHGIDPDYELKDIVSEPADDLVGNSVRHLFRLDEVGYLGALEASINALGTPENAPSDIFGMSNFNYVCSEPEPLRDSHAACQDIMFIIDTSCSPSTTHASVKEFLKTFVTKLQLIDPVFGSAVGIITFNKWATTKLTMTRYTQPWEVDDLISFIDDDLVLETVDDKCRTLPYHALNELQKHFGPQNGEALTASGDRPGFHNTVIFIGDLATYPATKRDKTIAAAEAAKELAELFILQTPNEFSDPNEETVLDTYIASSMDHIIQWVDPANPEFEEMCNRLVEIALSHECPQANGGQ
ncbi:unnamed protein product [Owenia fusiformis]|uniref:VWFA domain-containing protein n=1 Tax=Owenia fusiformis TaxID=6347 RepID=A0A8S4Q3Y2_OWEFU|nr:unnamed protein product [Owenia fusiformis]